jgi:micrococcal nuclease
MTLRRALRYPGRRGGRVSPRRRAAQAIVWLVFAAIAGLMAPALDDGRSRLRTMEGGCEVARVIDGDTVDLVCDGRRAKRARITGFDAPELFSPQCPAEEKAARAARDALARMVQGRPVEVAHLGEDKYRRALIDMRVGDDRVATRMVAEGHGRRYLGGLRGGWC